MADSQPERRYAAIKRFPGYRFDVDGGVWSRHVRGYAGLKFKEWRPLRPTVGNRGYLVVRLKDNEGRRVNCQVHRLILEAFRGRCPDGMEGCHKNGVRADCRLVNLRWGTRSSNHRDRYRHARERAQQRAPEILQRLTGST